MGPARSVAVLFLLVSIFAFPKASLQATECDETILAPVAAPWQYNIYLSVFPTPKYNFTFYGQSSISFIALQRSSFIELNAGKNLFVRFHSKVYPASSKGSTLNITRTEVIEHTDVIRLYLSEKLEISKFYTITADIKGHLRNDNLGFYRSKCLDASGSSRWVAATLFERSFARTVFPCFDEPKYKARFNVFIERASNLTARSNGKLISSKNATLSGRIVDHFDLTAPIPTYLVAFFVGGIRDVFTVKSHAVLGWTATGLREDMASAGDFPIRALKGISQYLGVKSDVQKVDFIDVCRSKIHSTGDWGLVTLGGLNALVSSRTSSLNKQHVARAVVREIIPQWFGGLVSPMAWTDHWWNKALASFFELYGMSKLEPTWRFTDLFPIICNQRAMKFDILPASIDKPAASTPEFTAADAPFSNYKAGAAKIRMFLHFVGEDNFRKGLKSYLDTYGSIVAQERDFVHEIVRYSSPKEPLEEAICSWVHQEGYPLIRVSRLQDGSINITQEPYYHDMIDTCVTGETNATWWIPLTWTTNESAMFNSLTPQLWFSPEQSSVNIKKPGGNDWIIFNLQSTGYYRVLYEPSEWEKLIVALSGPDSKKIHPVNRASLIDDALSFAKAGYLEYNIALRMLETLKNEMDYVPWHSALPHLCYLNLLMLGTESENVYKRFVSQIMHNVWTHLTFEENPQDTDAKKVIRGRIARWMCDNNDPMCLTGLEKYQKLFKEQKPVPGDLRLAIYCTLLRKGMETRNSFLDRYRHTTDTSEKIDILKAFTCSADPKELSQILSLVSLDLDEGDPKGYVFIMYMARRGGNATTAAVNFLREKFKERVAQYGVIGVKDILWVLGKTVTKATDLKTLKEIVDDNKAILSENKLTDAAEYAVLKATGNVRWCKRIQHHTQNRHIASAFPKLKPEFTCIGRRRPQRRRPRPWWRRPRRRYPY